MTCDKCHAEIRLGEWPFCPHGFGSASVDDDQLPGGPTWIENMSKDPVFVRNKTEWRAAMKKHGVRHVPDSEMRAKLGSDFGKKRQWFS